MKMGGGPRQFGIDEEQVPAVLKGLDLEAVDFRGFHIFAGSQILREDVLLDIQDQTVDLAIKLAQEAPGPVSFVNLGGGFGIPYFPGEERLDIARLGVALDAPVARARQAFGPETVLAVELGRFLVGEAGLYVSRIVDRKTSRGRTFLITDGGLHHHLALSGNFGQVIRKNYPVAVESRVGGEPCEIADVVGCLCTPLDRLGDQVPLPRVETGELFVVFQSGAYGASASPSAFLGHSSASEFLA
ncbi:MAG: pyridoxal-dependent decarboxylase, exosortase A system-associated, partial [Alphaproteobacteria bacterium]|nr:pyridoxal-dependent decarboxylase, exosortase A system-associated [Alphaproteobacteria bacterium]